MERKKTADQTPNNDKKQALDTAIRQIEKNFGKGAVMRLGDRPDLQVDAIPTGSLALDAALGIGGVPKGRIIEIYGPESSGKTTLALHIVAQAQKRGGEVAFVDAEHALDPDYAARIGVDIDSMLVSQPDTGEQALEITDALVRSGAVDVVVVDSVAALTPRAEIEGEMGDSHVGLQARLMSQSLRRAWLMSRAWRPTKLSPISPSISARGTRAATLSTTTTSMAPERTRASVISRACSPVSGCEISMSSTLTPSALA